MTRALAIAAVMLAALPARAEPLRLRGDALATAQAPAGLLVLDARDTSRPWLDADAVVWAGLSSDADADADADALIMRVELRDPRERGALRIGRHLVIAGGLRPLHVDGVSARGRLPRRIDVETFGGLPVTPGVGPRAWDWVIGARAVRPFGAARAGLAWVQRRDHGALHTHELALDASWTRGAYDVATTAAWDLIGDGLAEARVSAIRRRRGVRLEVFGAHRSAAHLLPATSLFSVLGDVPARLAGADVRWRAAPRLDVGGSAGVRVIDGDAREDVAARATLRLDDRGDGAIGLELRRQGAVGGGWTGARAFGRLPLGARWSASTELELAAPDRDTGRGVVWPWGLIAVAHRRGAWEAAGAIEASATPEHRSRVDALVRVTRRWELP
jgi:hypothetical protein